MVTRPAGGSPQWNGQRSRASENFNPLETLLFEAVKQDASLLAKIRARLPETQINGLELVDFATLATSEISESWFVDGLWPKKRSMHLYGRAKSGKSLFILWLVSNLAKGRDPFSGASRPRVKGMYLDREMTLYDLRERILDMNLTPDDLNEWLHYAFYPPLPPLDRPEGGSKLLEWCLQTKSEYVILDTFSRFVEGEENSNDTAQRFHLYTGSLLKQHDISLLRLDHENKSTGSSRGASAKEDDVDLVFRVEVTDNGLKLERKLSRVAGIAESWSFDQTVDPLGFRRMGYSYVKGALELAIELDSCGVSMDSSARVAMKRLKEKGIRYDNSQQVYDALRFLRERSIP